MPPLENGDRLTRDEFERRYNAMPNVKKAELIEGVVYTPSPVSQSHSEPHFSIIGWLAAYKSASPGTVGGDSGTIRLDQDNEIQPDAFLFVLPTHGGHVRKTDDDYLEGAPELVVEISNSSVSIDLNAKMNAYRRNGVREYIVWRVASEEHKAFVAELQKKAAPKAG
ncbi:MAG TPA: Uma2 family endonuclease [Planctomycetota bacterium]|nr:Uma2 family endonuclease [Planctomycetota bacterium]